MNSRKNRTSLFTVICFVLLVEQALAVTIQPKGKAIADVLGTSKDVSQKKLDHDQMVYYSKGSDGKAAKFAFVQEGLYPPNCTHTWIVGVDAASGKVTEVRPVEMSCPHAFPTKEVSFLSQFKGKAIADADKLDKEIDVVAKATGTSKLAIEAVKKSLKSAQSLKGQL
ncbi:MAG: FMN-binding protein [Bdellovibrionota bacterium]